MTIRTELCEYETSNSEYRVRKLFLGKQLGVVLITKWMTTIMVFQIIHNYGSNHWELLTNTAYDFGWSGDLINVLNCARDWRSQNCEGDSDGWDYVDDAGF